MVATIVAPTEPRLRRGLDSPTAMNRDLHAEEAQAAWGWASKGESRWPAQIAIFVAIALYLVLPDKLIAQPRTESGSFPTLEGVLCACADRREPETHHTGLEPDPVWSRSF